MFKVQGILTTAVLLLYGQVFGQGDSFMIPPPLSEFEKPAYPAPDWLRGAVIAEIPIRAFNHPNATAPQEWSSPFGTGSYLSLEEKLRFLKGLGVNVICLYSIYHHTPGTNLYAIRHHEADPSLGNLDDIKKLITAAHDMGMQVISNTNYYGVAQSSPMLEEHPDWFIGPENDLYGQRVFNLNNPELVEYLIDTHVWWCTEVGLDGWRIDIAHKTYRKKIWDEVLKACQEQGKSILLATEGAHLEGHIRGAGWGSFPVSLDLETPRANWQNPEAPYGSLRPYTEFSENDPYRIKDISSHNSTVPCPYNYDSAVCPREGAYQIQGSRFLFGYNLMFAPFVPCMMPGELFNATHLVVPGVMDHRLRGKLLHSYLDWSEVQQRMEMMEDFVLIARTRQEHSDIFHNNWYETRLRTLDYTSDPEISAKPYVRFLPGSKAVVVVGNNNSEKDARFVIQLPLSELGFDLAQELLVTNPWTGKPEITPADQIENLEVAVPKDRSSGGGVRVILIEKP